jgi:hypothetical protein
VLLLLLLLANSMRYIVSLIEVSLCVLLFATVYYRMTFLDASHFRMRSASDTASHTIDFMDSLYFALVTQSTVGFGSIVPISDVAKALVSVQVFSTIAFVLRWTH